VCFELGIGILNAPRKFFLVVCGPILKLQGLEGVGFQGKNCFTKMVSNFSEIDFGFIYHEKMSKNYEYDILVSAQVNRYYFFGGL
jgi:hypothetical protein